MHVASIHFKSRASAKLADANLQAALAKLQTNFVGGRAQRGEGRRDDDLDVVHVLRHAAEFLDERDRLEHGLVHLPVRRDKGFSAHNSEL